MATGAVDVPIMGSSCIATAFMSTAIPDPGVDGFVGRPDAVWNPLHINPPVIMILAITIAAGT